MDWPNHFELVFIYFQKKVSEIFRSLIIVLVTKSSILDQLCSFWVGRLQFSQNWGWNKKMEWANYFSQVFNYFQKSIRARWGLTSSITEHCFGHQIVNLAIIGDKIKKLDWPDRFGQVFTYFQKRIRTFSITEHCFGDQIVNFSSIVLNLGGYAQL